MIREKLIDKRVGDDRKFRWRSLEVSRTEGLSDAVFGFAITLLVVSLEVPKTFAELMQTMRGFGAFAISFTLLFIVWYNQYKFFRRYGLQDNITMLLNAALLFVVIFYVYPLKFVFTMMVNVFTGGNATITLPNGTIEHMVENTDQVAQLMMIFGAGYIAVFGLFVLLYWHAYRKREMLELNELEVFDTRVDIQESGLNVIIGTISVLIAVIGRGRLAGVAGMTYMLCPIVLSIHGSMMGRRRRKMEARYGFGEAPTAGGGQS
ncbi:MAG TPA: TMEM175 family protein [Pyrinomonadaceae bacterium]|nr:TMEM175 family protein [Pyrinomonadaceae bacterium]